MVLNYCKNKKQKQKFLPYCPKLYGAGLEPGTFEFFTYLPNDAVDYLWILKFLFWMNSASALNVHYFPTFSCTQLTYPRKVLDNNKKL